MVAKQKFLVVISVLEGRRFPKRSKHQLIAEARFDGELLATDPVEHHENPDFTQEIAWELDKKSLYQHRLQRSAIKVQLYAVDQLSTMREPIGYVMLDLRSAQNVQTSKWYPLLHGKYTRSKPEIRLGIYIDDDSVPAAEGFKAKDAPARIGQPSGSKPAAVIDPSTLKPVLIEDGAYYQIGPVHNSDRFVLSVTIAFASNLPQLIPSTQLLPDTGQGYFFYYSLLGNDISNTPFHDLISPNFPAERASTAIRSSVENLRAFFERQTGIQIHLCCGEQSLGSCEVSLKDLLKPGSTEIYMNPTVVEGIFPLEPPARLKSALPAFTEETAPCVGAAVMLRKEDSTRVSSGAPTSAPRDRDVSPIKPAPPGPPRAGRSRGPAEDLSDDPTTENGLSNLPHEASDARAKGKSPSPRKASPRSSRQQHSHAAHASATSSSTGPRYVAPSAIHHYNFSLDVRTVRNMETNVPLNIYARYAYPFFGSSAPVRTYPSVEVARGTEVTLPQSFCSFDFGTNYEQMEETFRNVPLSVELWNRDKQKDLDTLYGVVHIPLSQLLSSDRIPIHGAYYGWKQIYSNALPIKDPKGRETRLGEMLVQMSVEDMGPVHSQHVQLPSTESTSEKVAPAVEATETSKYNAALELEMWKELQERLFETKLKDRETHHMRALADEWKKRDSERELLVKKKVAEYNQLEEQLKKTMADFEKKQKQLSNNESEVNRLKKDLEREHDRKLQEMREASRRLKEECEHMVELERMKVTDLREQITRYKSMLDESDKKFHALDREFAVYREQQNSKPEVRLQSEINLLTLEKVELERKCDSVTKSKVHYKQQWGRALKELARLKQKEQESARQQLKIQQQELEHMRLRYLAAEEKEVQKTEMKELEDIKNEINRLKEKEKKLQSPTKMNDLYALQPDMDSSFDEHIARLIEERDALLKTGVYSSDDKIIADLDKQIREALSRKNT